MLQYADDDEHVREISVSFIQWSIQNPDLHLLVQHALEVVRVALAAPRSLADVLAGRDAAMCLYCYASDGGFLEMAAWFYSVYEGFCRSLLSATL
jgi:hypothetical protein